MFSWEATMVENACCLQTLFNKCTPCVISSPALSFWPLTPSSLSHCSLGQSLCANTDAYTPPQPREHAPRHRWAWPCLLPTRLLSYYSSSMVQGSGVVPSMRLLLVTSGPNTPEMGLQTAMLGDVWSCSERGSITVPLINSSSCHFLVQGPHHTAQRQ